MSFLTYLFLISILIGLTMALVAITLHFPVVTVVLICCLGIKMIASVTISFFEG